MSFKRAEMAAQTKCVLCGSTDTFTEENIAAKSILELYGGEQR
jgi:hypothetical protein